MKRLSEYKISEYMRPNPVIADPEFTTSEDVKTIATTQTVTDWADLTGKFKTVTEIPTATPTQISDQVVMYVSGATKKLYAYDYTSNTWIPFIDGTGVGTVTTVSVATANGLAGTVATPTTTPAITLSTTITGILKGNGTAISAASAGTDYYNPGGTDVAIADGGTGQGTAQLGINALTNVAGATNEHVLTKDTGTGNAIFKAVPASAPSSASYLTATAEAGLSAEVNLGALTTGMLYHTVAAGVSTPSTSKVVITQPATSSTLTIQNGFTLTVSGSATISATPYTPSGTDVAVADGGTGRSTGTTAYCLIATGTTATGAQQTLGNGATTQILVGGGASALPAWGTDIPTAVTIGSAYIYRASGTDVAFADGGTGISSWTQYLIPYAATTTSIGQIAIGTAGQVLTSNGAGAAPTFQASSGNVFYVYTASDTLVVSADTQRELLGVAGYTKKKEVKIYDLGVQPLEPTTVRVKFDVIAQSPAAGMAKVYINGVGVGTERTMDGSWTTWAEDFTILGSDLIQLYISSTTGGYTVYCKNFRICYDKSAVSPDEYIVNLD